MESSRRRIRGTGERAGPRTLRTRPRKVWPGKTGRHAPARTPHVGPGSCEPITATADPRVRRTRTSRGAAPRGQRVQRVGAQAGPAGACARRSPLSSPESRPAPPRTTRPRAPRLHGRAPRPRSQDRPMEARRAPRHVRPCPAGAEREPPSSRAQSARGGGAPAGRGAGGARAGLRADWPAPRSEAVNGGAAGPGLQNKGLAARGAAAAGGCLAPCGGANGRGAPRVAPGPRENRARADRGPGRMGTAGWGADRRAAVSTGGPGLGGAGGYLRRPEEPAAAGRVRSTCWASRRADGARTAAPVGVFPLM